VQGAIGQFTDTERWLKEQMVEELYDNFDIEIYERSRQVVSRRPTGDMQPQSDWKCSTPNGPDTATDEVFPFTSM
jgi:hypothetical protein